MLNHLCLDPNRQKQQALNFINSKPEWPDTFNPKPNPSEVRARAISTWRAALFALHSTLELLCLQGANGSSSAGLRLHYPLIPQGSLKGFLKGI